MARQMDTRADGQTGRLRVCRHCCRRRRRRSYSQYFKLADLSLLTFSLIHSFIHRFTHHHLHSMSVRNQIPYVIIDARQLPLQPRHYIPATSYQVRGICPLLPHSLLTKIRFGN